MSLLNITGEIKVEIVGSNHFSTEIDDDVPVAPIPQKLIKWFDPYITQLNYSDASKKELRERSLNIAEMINKPTDSFSDRNIWGKGRVRKGMVVGSIQSGKTASMLGVIANVLDHETKIIILLSGTKVALWHQTLLRLYGDLDTHHSKKIKSKSRLILPKRNVASTNSSEINYSSQEKIISESLTKSKKSLIFVIPKIKEHIYDLSSVLQRAINSQIGNQKIHMLVIDDESDDASILDANKSKTIPYAITRLWAGTDASKSFSTTYHENLFVTYLAYTATPQANILQVDTNPLSPKDFIFALKTPSNDDSRISFHEPKGLSSYYVGGDIFYEQDFSDYSPDTNFIQPLLHDENGDLNLEIPLQSYLIGASINMLRSERKYSNLSGSYESLASAKDAQIPTYSMVYHPAAVTDEHFLGKQEIVHWLNHGNLNKFQFDPLMNNNQVIEMEAFKNHFSKNEDKWIRFVEVFNETIQFTNNTFQKSDFNVITYAWNDLKSALLEEVMPNLKIRVINSKAEADSRPRFEVEKRNGGWEDVSDNLSIFVAGNVLSRGLTIERLAVTVFARQSSDPAADTQMQMQRWFGYRGEILPYCRIFMEPGQLDLFIQYHNSDKSLKERIMKIENRIDSQLDNLPYVLEGESSKSTKKVDTNKLPLRPSNYSQFGLIETSETTRTENLDLVKEFINKFNFSTVGIGNSTRGFVTSDSINYADIIDLLQSLKFTNHSPSINHPDFNRWKEYSETYGADCVTNLPDKEESSNLLGVGRCPYSIAAYLKFWSHVSIPGNSLEHDLFVHPTSSLWRDYMTPPPPFYVTIRNGSMSALVVNDKSKKLNIKHVQRAPKDLFEFQNLWGTATGSSNQYDDKLFDYHLNNYVPVPKNPIPGFRGIPDSYRPSNNPGVLSIYFVEFNTKTYVGFGIGLPAGGPEHIRSMSG